MKVNIIFFANRFVNLEFNSDSFSRILLSMLYFSTIVLSAFEMKVNIFVYRSRVVNLG